MIRLIPIVCLLAALADPSAVLAQPPPPSLASLPGPEFVRRLEIDQGGGVHLTRTFAVVFGDIKQGSGIAVGPAVSRKFHDGAFAQVKAEYSIKRFRLLQARYDSRPLFGRHGLISTRLRWQDAPRLSLYLLGPDSPSARVEFAERRTELSAFVRTLVAANTTLTAGSGLERYAISAGEIDPHEESLDRVPDLPGLASRPWFVHSFAGLAFDTRLSPDYSRGGRLLGATLHHYHDARDGAASFRRLEATAEQIVPLPGGRVSASGPGSALGVSVRTWLSQTGSGSYVPFFLMPSFGGGDDLRGYPDYRFRDRHALLLRAEYCWAVHEMVDLAALYEAGMVSRTVRELGPGGAAQSAGGGIRVHTSRAGLLRLDVARGRDGLKVSLVLTAGG